MAKKSPKNVPNMNSKKTSKILLQKTPPASIKPSSSQIDSAPSLPPLIEKNSIVQVEFRNAILNKIIHYEGRYLNTCGQAVLIKLHSEEGRALNPKLACMIYDKELNPNLNPAARLQQISALFQKIAQIRGFQTIDDFVQDLARHEIYLCVPKMGGMFKTKISGRLYDDPGFLFEFFEESYDLDEYISQFPTFLTLSLKIHLVIQLLSTYLILFDNPRSEIRFVHNDLFPANLLVFQKNWQQNLVVIDWAGGGFYHKYNRQFTETPLVYGRPAYLNIIIPYEMNPNHQFFHATTDYFLIANLVFFILSGGENPFIFLRNISEKKILDLIEYVSPYLQPYVEKKEPIPFAFPPGPKEWEEFGIQDLIRTQNRNDALKIIVSTNKIFKDHFPGIEDLFYRSFILGYRNPLLRPTPQDYFDCIQKHHDSKKLGEYLIQNTGKFIASDPSLVDSTPFSMSAKDLRKYNIKPVSTTTLIQDIRSVMQKSSVKESRPPEGSPMSSSKNSSIISPSGDLSSQSVQSHMQPKSSKNLPSSSNVDDIMTKMKDIFHKTKKPSP